MSQTVCIDHIFKAFYIFGYYIINSFSDIVNVSFYSLAVAKVPVPVVH
jgi:hypothetical protein